MALTEHQIEKILKEYEESELDDIRNRVKVAATMYKEDRDLRQIVQFMFGVEDSPPDLAQVFGSPLAALTCCRKTAIVLWPYEGLNDRETYGVSINELSEYIEKGVVIPLIQEPMRYIHRPDLVQLIKVYRPPSYFWRSNIVYSFLSGGDHHIERIGDTYFSGRAAAWYRRALQSKVIGECVSHRKTWEPRQQRSLPVRITERQQQLLRDSFAFKYVNAATFLSESLVDEILAEFPPEKSLKFLTTFHILTDHPISHALLTTAGVDLSSKDWQTFIDNKSDYVFDSELQGELISLPMEIMAAPTYRDYAKMRSAGIEPFPFKVEGDLSSFTKTDFEAYRLQVICATQKYQEWRNRLESRVAACTINLRIGVYGALGIAGLSGELADWEAAAGIVISGLTDRALGEKIVSSIKLPKLDHLVATVLSKDIHSCQ